jgi:protein CWC15
MTTAHRPTWAPAKGGAEEGGARFFAPSERRMAKDLRSQTEMKYRCVVQHCPSGALHAR